MLKPVSIYLIIFIYDILSIHFQQNQMELSRYIQERERYSVELNKESTTKGIMLLFNLLFLTLFLALKIIIKA